MRLRTGGAALLVLAGCAGSKGVVATKEQAAGEKPKEELVYLAPRAEALLAAQLVLERAGYPVGSPAPTELLTPRKLEHGDAQLQNRSWSRYYVQGLEVAPGRTVVRIFRLEQSDIGEPGMQWTTKRGASPGLFQDSKERFALNPWERLLEVRKEHHAEAAPADVDAATAMASMPEPEDILAENARAFRGDFNGDFEPFEVARGRRDLAKEREVTQLLEAVPSLEMVGGEAPVPLRSLVVDDRLPVSKPLELRCGEPLPGADALLRPGTTVLVGDPLGTREVPVALAQLACTAAAAGVPVVLGLSVSSAEQAALDVYARSEGTGSDLAKLLTGTFWRRTYQDGRSSGAVLGLIEHARALRAAGRAVEVVALDAQEARGNAREAHLAERLLSARAAHPGAVVLAALGDVHVRTRKGAPWDAAFVPVGARLVEKGVQPVVLDAAFQRGSQHSCRFNLAGKVACRVYMRSPTEATLHPYAAPRGVELFAGAREDGMHGRLLLGELTASLPALRVEEALLRAQRQKDAPKDAATRVVNED